MKTKRSIRGDIIRHLRDARGWSQDDLARESGIDRTTISRVERGIQEQLWSSHLMQLASAFGVRPESLVHNPPRLPSSDMPTAEAFTQLIESMTEDEKAAIWEAVEVVFLKRDARARKSDGESNPPAAEPDEG